jgi:hypothetical protein
MRYVYDSGALIAIESRGSAGLADHKVRLARQDEVQVPAVVAAQVVRNPDRQFRVMTVLRGCDLVPFDRRHHTPVGRLLAAAGTTDVVDAFVAWLGARADVVVTSDMDDIRRLLDVLGADVTVVPA